jgi:hypothetical protein
MKRWRIITECWTGWYLFHSYHTLLFLSIEFLIPLSVVQGNDMDASRGFLSGTVDKFKMVRIPIFELYFYL